MSRDVWARTKTLGEYLAAMAEENSKKEKK